MSTTMTSARSTRNPERCRLHVVQGRSSGSLNLNMMAAQQSSARTERDAFLATILAVSSVTLLAGFGLGMALAEALR